MKNFINKYQMPIFLMLTLAISWFPWYAGLGAETLNMGPSISAFLVALLVGGFPALRKLLKRFARVRASIWIWFTAIFGTAIMYLIGVLVYWLASGEIPPFTMIREELRLIPLYLVFVVLMPWQGPVGEEFGWRGYMLPRLQGKFGPLLTSVFIGVFWGLWHLPVFFADQGVIPAMVESVGFLFFIPYTLGTVANSIIMTWLFNRSGRSALIAGIVWHAATNFWAPVLLSDSSLVAARQGLDLPTIPSTLYLIVLGVQILFASTLVMTTRGKLGINNDS